MVPNVTKLNDSSDLIKKGTVKVWFTAENKNSVQESLERIFPQFFSKDAAKELLTENKSTNSQFEAAKKAKARKNKEFISGLQKKNIVDCNYIDNVLRVIINNENKHLKDGFDKDALESFQRDFVAEKNDSGVLSEIFEKVLYICSTYGLYENVCFKFVDFETGQFVYDIKLPLQTVFIDKSFDPDYFTIYLCWHLKKEAFGFYDDPGIDKDEFEENVNEKHFVDKDLPEQSSAPEIQLTTSKMVKITISCLVSLFSTLAFLYYVDTVKLF